MRHVSTTHRVALDWLFDRINLEPKIQIQYVDTKNQLADMLTKGNFTRDEWNHLLHLFNLMRLSMLSCNHFSNFLSDPIGKQSAMSKRGQETFSNEGSPMAKPKPMVPAKARPVNLVLRSPWENPPGDRKMLKVQILGNSVIRRNLQNSTCTRRLVRAATPSREFQNMRYTNHQYMTKIFQYLQRKIGNH